MPKGKKAAKIEVDEEVGNAGDGEESVYSEEGREALVEDDEIEPFEEGFMEGAEGRGKKNCCSQCGRLLNEDKNKVIEEEFEGELLWFCSEKHAEDYRKKHKERENVEKEED